jgi:hypothetical protein
VTTRKRKAGSAMATSRPRVRPTAAEVADSVAGDERVKASVAASLRDIKDGRVVVAEAFAIAARMSVDPRVVASVARSISDVKAGHTVSLQEAFAK